MQVRHLREKATVAVGALLPAVAFAAAEPFDATFVLIGAKAALIVTAAWVLFGATRAPALVMKIASKFMNKAS